MNDPRIRPYWWPSSAPFGANLDTSAMPSVANGGILGDLGQNIAAPWMDAGTPPGASGELSFPVRQSWGSSLPDVLLQAGHDPETLKFHEAWRRLFSHPSLAAFSSAVGPAQLRTPFGGPGFPSPPGTTRDFVSEPEARALRVAPVAYPKVERLPGPTQPPGYSGPIPSDEFALSPTPRTQGAAIEAALYPEAPNRSPERPSVTDRSTVERNPPEILSDVTPDNLWIPGAEYAAKGHHKFPQAFYKGMLPATRDVLEADHTGRLLVRSINGQRHENDAFHRAYSEAVGEILMDFMAANKIPKDRPDQLTPGHARTLLKLVTESEDPRILTYHNFIRLLRLFPWLRGGGRE